MTTLAPWTSILRMTSWPCGQGVGDLAPRRAVPVAVDLVGLQQLARDAQGVEGLGCEELVGNARYLAGARGARRAGDDVVVVGIARPRRERLDDRVLAHARRPADDHQQRPGRAEQHLRILHDIPPPGRRPADASLARSPSSTASSEAGSGASTRTSLRRHRRDELQAPRVQEQALEPVRALARRPRAVHHVARDRVTERGEMHADLVRAPGDQVQLQERPRGEALPDAIARDRGSPVGHHGHPLAVLRVAPDRRLDPPDGRGHRALDQRQVGLPHAPRLELGHDPRLGGVVAGHDQEPGRVPVQPVDDPRPRDARDPAVVVAAGEQRVDERARASARAPGAPPAPPACPRSAGRRPRRRRRSRSWGPAPGGTGSRRGGTSSVTAPPRTSEFARRRRPVSSTSRPSEMSFWT